MSDTTKHFDIVIVGAGPAGMAAAVAASQSHRSVAVIESNPWTGGQLWRRPDAAATPRAGRHWHARFKACKAHLITEASVGDSIAPGHLLVETPASAFNLFYDRLIMAVGAREQFMPFPGWTLPNVFGAGGLQLLAKSGWPLQGKRVVVAGSGPLLLAVGAQLRKRGARVLCIAEQTSLKHLVRFGLTLPRLGPSKLWQALVCQSQLLGVPYRTGYWPIQAHGTDRLEGVTLRRANGATWNVTCDMLGCAFGMVPNLELARLLGCDIEQGTVRVDTWQKTSVNQVYCAGEPTGVGGMDRALIEGQIAGYAVTDQPDKARALFGPRQKTHDFTRVLNQGFALRDELRTLTTPDTIVCRCEDVTAAQLACCDDFRTARLYTRCGMGPCQGRNCSTATHTLYGWETEFSRPPVTPIRVRSLVDLSVEKE
ncbi:MAG: NAD(P)/FAD-dependent oxidoreductase [Phycisphaerae bacterium]|nr:NAD(P)/FAD-dependent oxidoreductase [Phycisphaerae bacterium]